MKEEKYFFNEREIIQRTFYGEELQKLDDRLITSIAACYIEVFSESWHRSFTLESAKEEIKTAFKYEKTRIPIASILFYEEKVIAFAWGCITSAKYISAERDMPFKLPDELKQVGVQKARYWLKNITKKEELFIYGDYGAKKEHRGKLSAFMSYEIFDYLKNLGINTLLYWTNLRSRAFELGVGAKLIPIHFFEFNDLVLIAGNVRYSHAFMEKIIKGGKKELKQVYGEAGANINDYFCR